MCTTIDSKQVTKSESERASESVQAVSRVCVCASACAPSGYSSGAHTVPNRADRVRAHTMPVVIVKIQVKSKM